MLKFDYSGLFLATLSVEGHTVHIWEIKKKPFRNALDELGIYNIDIFNLKALAKLSIVISCIVV